MMQAYKKCCVRCGLPFETVFNKRLYCSNLCRRKYQDERRKAERAEEAERKKALLAMMPDPCGLPSAGWNWNELDAMTGNQLIDGWNGTPCGLTLCPDEAVGGVLACMNCTRNPLSEPREEPHTKQEK